MTINKYSHYIYDPTTSWKGNIFIAVSTALITVISVLGVGFIYAYGNQSPPSELLARGIVEFDENNFDAASDLFNQSYNGYMSIGQTDNAIQAPNWEFENEMIYCWNIR